MIQHMVLFNLANDTGEEWERLSAEIEENLGRMPQVLHFRIGRAIHADSKYKYMFSMDLESRDSLRDYMEQHKPYALGTLIPAMGGWDGDWMRRLDYELIEFKTAGS